MNIPELLAPAGNFEKMVTALHFGADAVYMGLSQFSLRARADNFTTDEMKAAAEYVRKQGKKLYVTINIFPHNRDMVLLDEHLLLLKNIMPQAVIVSDAGVFDRVRRSLSEVPVHVSTQANITNSASARFWERLGAKRLVLSRELSIEEIREIREAVSIELECFVHGAICISYAGRCYISSFLANRSANRGECTNSCRWSYTLMEEKRKDSYLPVYENDRGTFLLSSRDLCMIEHLDKLADAGVNSFKIEGRMKGINYLAGVVNTYREAVDSLAVRPYSIRKEWLKELSMFSSRGYTTGMYFGFHPDEGYNHDEAEAYRMSHELVGVVSAVENGRALISLRNNLRRGDSVAFLSPGRRHPSVHVAELSDEKGGFIESGRNDERVYIASLPGVKTHDLVRRQLKHVSL